MIFPLAQVTFLEIIVNEKTSFIPSNFLHEIERHVDHRVEVIWWFKVDGTDDVMNMVNLIQQNQVNASGLSCFEFVLCVYSDQDPVFRWDYLAFSRCVSPIFPLQ